MHRRNFGTIREECSKTRSVTPYCNFIIIYLLDTVHSFWVSVQEDYTRNNETL